MDELSWLADRARRLSARREPELSTANLESLEREHGPEAPLERRREIGVQLSGECFRSGLFEEAARWFRQRLSATQQLSDFLAQSGDEDGARREVEELARHAWAVGDLELFGRYVEEGCDPRRELRPRLEVYPAMFLSWAVLGHRFHPQHWSAQLDASVEIERASLKMSWTAETLGVAEGILVDARLALCRYWQGDFNEAAELAQTAVEAFRARRRHRPEGLPLPHVRAWRLRLEGLALLLAGREDPSQLAAAGRAFAKALAATALTRDVDWKDLVILHLTALAWRNPSDESVAAFEAGFPRLAPVLARERCWGDES